nr:MAG: polyprotein 2 [Picornavirales sp.]
MYFKASTDAASMTIAKYLGKPKKIADGQLSNTDNALSFTAIKLPYDLISDPVYWDKLKGFLGLRATLVLTFQVNAERFQQGRYMVTAVPCGGVPYTSKVEESVNLHTASLTQRTQVPRVEIDINTEKACVMRLPYCCVTDYHPLQMDAATKDHNIWYSVRIFPYSALEAVTGAQTCNYTLWCHMEDVELIGQAIPVSLQANFSTSVVKKKASNSQKEAESVGVGPISNMAAKISKASNILTVIPYVGAYMSGVSWAADIVGSVASVFGFSSPTNMAPVQRVSRNAFAYATSVDNVDQGIPLSMSIKNEVKILPGLSPTNHDELSIAHFCGRSTWQRTVSWSINDTDDHQIADMYVGLYPVSSAPHSIPLPITQLCYTPAQYLGTRFAKWRGSVCFKIKMVKTEFHTGRFAICFNPLARSATDAAIVESVQPYIQRDIVDINGITEYDFCIPYISEIPYLSTNATTNNFFYGTLQLRVVDPIVCPDTAPDSITLLIETYMADDIEFATPKEDDHVFVDSVPIQLQGALGDMTPHEPSLDTSLNCIGERIMSLRTLAKRFCPIRRLDLSAPPTSRGIQYILPFGTQNYTFATSTIYDSYSDIYTDLARMFLFSRGGVRLKATRDPTNDNSFILGAVQSDSIFTPWLEGYPALSGLPTFFNSMELAAKSAYMITEAHEQQQIEVSVPQYHYTHSRVENMHYCSQTYPYYSATAKVNSQLVAPTVVYVMQSLDTEVLSADTPVDLKVRWYRACADDADFSFFISIPPMASSVA